MKIPRNRYRKDLQFGPANDGSLFATAVIVCIIAAVALLMHLGH